MWHINTRKGTLTTNNIDWYTKLIRSNIRTRMHKANIYAEMPWDKTFHNHLFRLLKETAMLFTLGYIRKVYWKKLSVKSRGRFVPMTKRQIQEEERRRREYVPNKRPLYKHEVDQCSNLLDAFFDASTWVPIFPNIRLQRRVRCTIETSLMRFDKYEWIYIDDLAHKISNKIFSMCI
jgi:hypothetical protein